MKVLVVGGAGMIGGHIALRLKGKGHDVTIAGRNPPASGTPLGALPFLRVDYINDTDTVEKLKGFDMMVFAAGNDIRHVPQGGDYYAHVTHANAVAQPAFFAAAKQAGVKIAINIGSFYPHVAPDLLKDNPYMQSRLKAHEGIAALKGPDFRVISIDAPFVVGAVPGLDTMFKAYVQYAEGLFQGMPVFAPPGGVNFVSTDTISDAVESVIEKGENGRAYLIGDENLSIQQFFGEFFKGVGKDLPPVVNQEHPMLPDPAITWGRGNNLFFETDAAETAMLNYRKNDVLRTIREEIVPQYRSV
ncbi:MAG TPA: NAD(P)-dependent oxidoreductase [Alphaproteobacteria bacterium]|jgi:nucleoside-diphosphate-sugar epimerase|nr:NAD(P)-dependent oxidoreductase [Alphaproteobacteria bacterium]